MSSRIHKAFTTARDQGRATLIPYITCGDPDLGDTLELMHALASGGADIIELGVPFSDPMADGPIIQQAMERALSAGTTLDECLSVVRSFRERDTATAIVLFGYTNPLHAKGYDQACEAAASAGVDGLLVVDLPPEESAPLREAMEGRGLDWVPLVTPTTGPERLEHILSGATGFTYAVSVAGVTGAELGSWDQLASRVESVKALSPVPVAVGFGVRTPSDAQQVAAFADGVVVGSALIDAVQRAPANEAAARGSAFLADLAGGIRGE